MFLLLNFNILFFLFQYSIFTKVFSDIFNKMYRFRKFFRTIVSGKIDMKKGGKTRPPWFLSFFLFRLTAVYFFIPLYQFPAIASPVISFTRTARRYRSSRK